MKDHRMELVLNFKPRESFFLVLSPGKLNPSAGLVTATDLTDLKITSTPGSLKAEGWGVSGTEHSVSVDLNGRTVEKKWKSSGTPGPVNLSGEWKFQLAPKALDHTWSGALEEDTLEIPVMKFQAGTGSPAGNTSGDLEDPAYWRTVKITDLYNNRPGVQRYLGGWNSWWIGFYDPSRHLPPVSGGTLVFRKKMVLSTVATEAKIAITADEKYQLTINGESVGADDDWKSVESYAVEKFLKPGNNTIEVTTTNSNGLLLEGFVSLKNGMHQNIWSDESWLVSGGDNNWRPAFRLAFPPLGKWGAVRNPWNSPEYPLSVWYRCQLPPGAVSLQKPDIRGKYKLFVNGTELKDQHQGNKLDISRLLKKEGNILTIRVEAPDQHSGLITPIRVICQPTTAPLVSWTNLGLDWYSGRGLYSKKVNIPADWLNTKTRLMLDLGKVDHFAEIWVNKKMVTFCPWGPYQADITNFVKAGENSLAIVVSNLLANKATWNILDDNLLNRSARWWHDGSITREKEKLESGLLGPVQIVPYTYESAVFEAVR
jgi:hypothetical protein